MRPLIALMTSRSVEVSDFQAKLTRTMFVEESKTESRQIGRQSAPKLALSYANDKCVPISSNLGTAPSKMPSHIVGADSGGPVEVRARGRPSSQAGVPVERGYFWRIGDDPRRVKICDGALCYSSSGETEQIRLFGVCR